MKKFWGVLIIAVVALACAAASAEVALDGEHFPDEAFRACVAQYDANGDGVLQDEEIDQIIYIECFDMGITSLKGIENLSALVRIDCYNNQIAEADFSLNRNLASIQMYSNLLTKINVSSNTGLTELRLSNNRLTSLKLPKAKNLCVLDVSSNSNLKKLDVSGSPLMADAVKRTKPTDYIWWDGGYAINWIIDTSDEYIFFGLDKWVKVTSNGKTIYKPTEVEEFRYDGVRYAVNNTKKTAAVSGVTDMNKTSLVVVDSFELAGSTYKVTSIKNGAFKGMKKLKTLTIGKNVTSIGKNACNGCKNLRTVTIKTTKLKSIGAGAFKGTTKKTTYKCPSAKLSKYKKLLVGAGAAKDSKYTK